MDLEIIKSLKLIEMTIVDFKGKLEYNQCSWRQWFQ